MTKSRPALIMLSVSVFLWGPAFSEAQEKDGGTETPAPRSQSSPAPSDSQSVPPKPSTDVKPQSQPSPPTKTDSSTDHKEGASEKPATPKPSTDVKPQSKPSAPTKADSGDHKEGAPEKHAPRTQHPPAASDSQSGPAKPSTDAKSQSQSGPPTKSDAPAAEPENKEKDSAAKKPLGSLILCVKLALMGDARLFRYDIEVGDDQQTVTLTGRVSTEEEKTASMEIAQGVQGVKGVVNKLAIEKDLAKTLLKKQDEILTTLIKERFSKSATLKAANFEVKTEDGVVQLTGTVRFQVIALEAAETARQVPGVRAVNTEKIRLEGES